MGKFNYQQNSFKKGELGPKLHSKGNSPEYLEGCSLLQNFIPSAEGGIFRRPGTKFFYDVGVNCKLIPFIVDKETAYIVALNNTAKLSTVAKIYNINVQGMFGKGAGFTAEITPTIGYIESTFYDYLPPNIDVTGYNYAQINDVLVITHNSGTVPTLVIMRTGTSTFDIAFFFNSMDADKQALWRVDTGMRIPFKDVNISSVEITLTKPAATYIANASGDMFDSTKDIGRAISITIGSTYGLFLIESITSAKVANLYRLGAGTPTIGTATTNWSLGLVNLCGYTNVSAHNTAINATYTDFPRTVSYYNQRLIFGGTRLNPDTIMVSQLGNIFTFAPPQVFAAYGFSTTPTVKNAFVVVPASNEINKIQWIASSTKLEIGTLGTEYVGSIFETQDASSSVMSIDAQTSHGSSDTMPVRVGKSTLFISRDGRRVREFIFNDENGSFISRNISILNPEIVDTGFVSGDKSSIVITQLAYQSSIDTVWAITSLGYLIGLTFDSQNNLAAWHRHPIGGTSVQVKSIIVLPSVTSDVLWILTYRIVAQLEKYFIERISSKFDYNNLLPNSTLDDDYPVFTDCATIHKLSDLSVITISTTSSSTDILTLVVANNLYKYFDYVKVKYHEGTTPISGLTNHQEYYCHIIQEASPSRLQLCLSIADVGTGTYIQIGTTSHSAVFPTLEPIGFAGINTMLAVGASYGPLTGETVSILADGVVLADVHAESHCTPIDGINTYTQVIWGLPYVSQMKSLRYEAGGGFGTPEGSIQRIHEIVVEFYNSYYAQYGRDATNLLDFAGMDKITRIDTGIAVKFPGGSQRGDQIVISTNKPLPLTVSSIIAKGVTYDG